MPTDRLFRAAKMDTTIEIQEEVTTADGRGGWSEVWTKVVECKAAVSPIRAETRYQADGANADTVHRIVTRWMPSYTIQPGMRILIGTREIAITGVTNVEEKNRFLEILGTE
jgi:SPP1 family predicted phage head-tail adaptor